MSSVVNSSQSENHRSQIAEKCHKDLKDITRDCIETGATFICLKVDKSIQLLRPVPDKTLIIIGLGRLHAANGMFNEVDLQPGACAIVSGDEAQNFNRGNKGGGLGIVLQIKFKSLSEGV